MFDVGEQGFGLVRPHAGERRLFPEHRMRRARPPAGRLGDLTEGKKNSGGGREAPARTDFAAARRRGASLGLDETHIAPSGCELRAPEGWDGAGGRRARIFVRSVQRKACNVILSRVDMERITVELDLPRDLLGVLRVTEDERGPELKLLIALELFREEKISSGKAAEVVGLSKSAFID